MTETPTERHIRGRKLGKGTLEAASFSLRTMARRLVHELLRPVELLWNGFMSPNQVNRQKPEENADDRHYDRVRRQPPWLK